MGTVSEIGVFLKKKTTIPQMCWMAWPEKSSNTALGLLSPLNHQFLLVESVLSVEINFPILFL